MNIIKQPSTHVSKVVTPANPAIGFNSAFKIYQNAVEALYNEGLPRWFAIKGEVPEIDADIPGRRGHSAPAHEVGIEIHAKFQKFFDTINFTENTAPESAPDDISKIYAFTANISRITQSISEVGASIKKYRQAFDAQLLEQYDLAAQSLSLAAQAYIDSNRPMLSEGPNDANREAYVNLQRITNEFRGVVGSLGTGDLSRA